MATATCPWQQPTELLHSHTLSRAYLRASLLPTPLSLLHTPSSLIPHLLTGLAGSIFWLVILVIMITFMSDYLVGAIDGAAEDLGLSQIFLTAVVLPNVNNAPEHAVAIMFAIKNKINGSVTIALGSAAQLLTFVLPLGVIGGWMVGTELTLEVRTRHERPRPCP